MSRARFFIAGLIVISCGAPQPIPPRISHGLSGQETVYAGLSMPVGVNTSSKSSLPFTVFVSHFAP